MKKKVVEVFGHKEYLLGRNKDGKCEYLEEFHFDCDWYWGVGYIETFTNDRNPEKSKDICSHTHFSSQFLNKNKCAFDAFKEHYAETTLTDGEIWILCDLMSSAYSFGKVAEICYCGNSRYTGNADIDLLDKDMYDEIVSNKIPMIKDSIERLLSPKKN